MKNPTLPPENARDAMCRLLSIGLILIRSRPNDGELCARVGDYLHNLPDIVSSPSDELLDFHWNIERRAYLHGASAEEAHCFAPFWEQLRPFVPHPESDEEAISQSPSLSIAA